MRDICVTCSVWWLAVLRDCGGGFVRVGLCVNLVCWSFSGVGLFFYVLLFVTVIVLSVVHGRKEAISGVFEVVDFCICLRSWICGNMVAGGNSSNPGFYERSVLVGSKRDDVGVN